MKKFLVLGSILSTLVLTGAGCSNGATPVMPPQVNSPAQTPLQTTLPESKSTAPKPETKQITIANFAFGPASITIKAGTIVKWTNDDQFAHSIKSANGGFADSANLNTGDSYEFKFDKPGVYSYACGIHPSMRGQVTVE